MKKGLCIVLSTLLAVMTFAACTKSDTLSSETETQTNADGSVYVVVVDEDGNDVTDANGEKVTSVLSDKEVSQLDKEKSKASEKSSEKASKEAKLSGSTGTTTTKAGSTEKTSSLEDIANSDMEVTAAKKDLLPEGTTVKQTSKTTLRESVIEKTIKTGKFTLKTNIVSNGTQIPATIAFNGDNMCMDLTYSGWNMRMLTQDGKIYLVFPALKMYSESGDAEDALGDFSNISSDQTYVKTTKVDDYTCEEYTSDGATIKYYFDSNNNWKRWESIDEDDVATVFEVTSFTSDVDSSLFSLKGFTKLSEDALADALS